jgi:ferredoxin
VTPDDTATDDTVTVTVRDGDDETTLTAPTGAILRDVLLDAGFSPYTRYTASLNCGGRGLCATCGVRVRDGAGEHPPDHWHDRLAARFGYPRLSCQVVLTDDVAVEIPDKRVWGGREPE